MGSRDQAGCSCAQGRLEQWAPRSIGLWEVKDGATWPSGGKAFQAEGTITRALMWPVFRQMCLEGQGKSRAVRGEAQRKCEAQSGQIRLASETIVRSIYWKGGKSHCLRLSREVT